MPCVPARLKANPRHWVSPAPLPRKSSARNILHLVHNKETLVSAPSAHWAQMQHLWFPNRREVMCAGALWSKGNRQLQLLKPTAKAPVVSHLGYCSSLLAGLPAAAIRPSEMHLLPLRIKAAAKWHAMQGKVLVSHDTSLLSCTAALYPRGSCGCRVKCARSAFSVTHAGNRAPMCPFSLSANTGFRVDLVKAEHKRSL